MLLHSQFAIFIKKLRLNTIKLASKLDCIILNLAILVIFLFQFGTLVKQRYSSNKIQ